MVDVAREIVVARGHVAAKLLVVGLVVALAQQVEAVELVEDFDGDAVAAFACGWVGDLEGAFGVEVHLEHFFAGDHRVAD